MVLSVDVAVVVPVKRSVEVAVVVPVCRSVDVAVVLSVDVAVVVPVSRSVEVAVVLSVDVAVVRCVVVNVLVDAGNVDVSVDVTVLPGAVVTYVLTAYRTALALRWEA